MTSGERRHMIVAVRTSEQSVVSTFLNWGNDGNDIINSGRVFQTFAAATGKVRSPIVL